MKDRVFWLWLAELHLRSFARARLLETFGSPERVWSARREELEALPWLLPEERRALAVRDTGPAEATAARCHSLGVKVLTLSDADFPLALRNIPDPPAVLFLQGNLPDLERQPCIAVVGTRHSSEYGEAMARQLGRELAEQGAVVVTGLAAGIDTCAADSALRAGGTVIGMLGVAINEVYPRNNADLYARVSASGVLISEYPPDSKGGGYRFRLRNRLMAGIAQGVVVVEAPEQSGALITAHLANEYGRDVFAVPGNCGAPGSRGCNRILREYAALVESGTDILEEYEGRFPVWRLRRAPKPETPRQAKRPASVPQTPREPKRQPPAQQSPREPTYPTTPAPQAQDERPGNPRLSEQLSGLSEAQLHIVGAIRHPGMQVDDIIAACGLPAHRVLSELTVLQVLGFVSQEPGKRFSLNIK